MVQQYARRKHRTQNKGQTRKRRGSPQGDGGSPSGHWCLVCSPDPGWSLLPRLAWRSLGPQCGIPPPAWCCMARGLLAPGAGPILGLPWIGLMLPFTTGFFPSGGSRKPGTGQPRGFQGMAGRPFPVAVLCPVRSRGLPVSFILNVGLICVA